MPFHIFPIQGGGPKVSLGSGQQAGDGRPVGKEDTGALPALGGSGLLAVKAQFRQAGQLGHIHLGQVCQGMVGMHRKPGIVFP